MSLIAASESATVEVDQADRLRRTGAAIRALSLTQLNGMHAIIRILVAKYASIFVEKRGKG